MGRQRMQNGIALAPGADGATSGTGEINSFGEHIGREIEPVVYHVYRVYAYGYTSLYATYWREEVARQEAEAIQGIVTTSAIIADYTEK